jgi:tetratricopeptide (TPR) repeat protein
MNVELHSISRRGVFLAVLVALAAFIAYAPTIGYDYVALDDDVFVSENPVVMDGFSLPALKAAWSTAPENYWAPLLWMSFMLDVELFGLAPWGFHLTNAFLFSLNAGLLFWLLRRWTGRIGVALAAALLWALHPARVESVAWITARKDVLSGLFFLLGTGAYVEARRGGLRHGVVLAWLCLVVGGMAKQVLIMLPPALVLLDVWPLGRTKWGRIWRDGWRLAAEKWAFWGVAAALAFLPIWFHYDRGAMLDVSVSRRLAMIPIHYLFYFQKLLWPVGLMPLQPDLPFRGTTFAAGLGILAGMTWGLWRIRKESPWALMGWVWFVGLLFPLSGVVWAGQERLATRFMYLPQIGLTLAVVLGADAWLACKKWNRRWGLGACMLVVAAYGAQTYRLLPHWRDEVAFSQAVWTYNAGHETACLLGGDWHMTRGEWAAADAAYARGANMGNKRCLARLSWLRLWCGQAEAVEELWGQFEQARGARLLDFTARDVAADRQILWTVHGQILRARGDYAGAIAALEEAVKLEADPAAFLVAEFMRTCHEAGQPGAAASAAERLRLAKGIAIREWRDLLPRYLQFWQEGGRGLAFGFFKEYARRHPEDGLALNNMAWLLATAEPDGLVHAGMAEWPAKALEWAELALERGGLDQPGAWDTLGAARANAGDFEGAIAAVERARELSKRTGEWMLNSKVQSRLAEYRAGKPWRQPDERAKAAGKNLPR